MQLNREQAVCIYLLYLVGVTIFTDKTTTYVNVIYLKFFYDLELVNNYAWGAASLAHLYKELNNGFRYQTNHLAGFATLFHVNIEIIIYLIVKHFFYVLSIDMYMSMLMKNEISFVTTI